MSSRRSVPEPVKSNETLFTVLEGLEELDGATVTELAEHTGKAKSTVHRHLRSLYEHDYVVREEDAYRLSLRFLNLGSKLQRRTEHFSYLQQKVRSLADETGKLVQFVVPEHEMGYLLLCERGTDAVQTGMQVGTRIHLHHVAAGKAILADLPKEEVESVIERRGLPGNTEHTITDPDDLIRDIETIEDRGYAMDMGEYIEELWSVGVAVRDTEGRPLGGIGVAAPARRFEDEWFTEELPGDLLSVANEIELQINYL